MTGTQPYPAWSVSVEDSLRHFQVDPKKGLSSKEVALRLEKYGPNELVKEPGKPMWKLVLEQFNDTLVKILLAAAVVSFVLAYVEQHGAEEEGGLTAFVEPLVILLILIINAVVGVWQESNAERALEALKEMQSEHAKVLREGEFVDDLSARELVPGDIVELRTGDKVPADMRLIQLRTATMKVEQASLTGESMAVQKSPEVVVPASVELQSKECMVFAGTVVVSGSCLCVVAQTGMETEIGKIQEQIQKASEEDDDTPLKKKLDEFGERLTLVISLVCLLVWIINYKHFLSLEFSNGKITKISFSFEKCTYYFKIAVALAVAAIPEGLPAVITTCLALGTRKMAQKNAIVRKLPSVETLGCTTVICSDKTGTLTTNQMSVTNLIVAGASPALLRDFAVEGTTFNPLEGCIPALVGAAALDASLASAAEVCALCNDASLVREEGKDTVKATGAPTEAALKVLVEKMGVPEGGPRQEISKLQQEGSASLLACNSWWAKGRPRVATLEFDRNRKSMSVITKTVSGSRLLVKGAAENILERSTKIQLMDGSVVPLTPAARDAVAAKAEGMASAALRVLALAYSDSLSELAGYDGSSRHRGHVWLQDLSKYEKIESGLTFVGMVGLRDPPREEVADAVADCKDAGIRVIVITGDNKSTAEAICREIGVLEDGQVMASRSFTGKEFMALSPEKKRDVLRKKGGLVFSRAEPKHKQDIVRMLKDDGEVVAMTGDGVNDAPALKLADIGIAMGISGTEVAKEASDMVLADDNFSTIVSAVAEGRSIYNNMKAFIRYMISSNIGEVASIFLTAALGMPEGLIPVQLLWVNLVTDGPPATALGFNPPDPDIMRKPPRRSDDALINGWVFFRYVVIGTYVGVATVGIFALWFTHTSFMGIDLSKDGHTLVTFDQLRNWSSCATWENFEVGPFTAGSQTFTFDSNPCDYFVGGKVKATTLSLSVLVSIEMFNSLNALSEDGSLLRTPPWVNPYLLVAMAVSFGLHFVILYVPFLASIFGIVPLSLEEWQLVLLVSLPVILIDEVLKFCGRRMSPSSSRRVKKHKAY